MSDRASSMAAVQGLIANESLSAGEEDGTVSWLRRLCGAASRALPASGAGISLMTDMHSIGVAAASEGSSRMLEELQFTFGEGPCRDAHVSRHPVLVPDLEHADRMRWPLYSPAALEHGVRAVFAFPLQMGAARLGVLDIYREQVGPLSPESLSQALTFAEVAVSTLLAGLEASPDESVDAGLGGALEYRSVLYQAQGMVMIQLDVSLREAIVRLRAYAFAQDRGLGAVANDIVERRLTLDRDEL